MPETMEKGQLEGAVWRYGMMVLMEKTKKNSGKNR